MNLIEEELFTEALIKEARKLNPKIGYYVQRLSPALSGNLEVKLTNGVIAIGRLVLHEYARSGNKTPISFIEETALSFRPL